MKAGWAAPPAPAAAAASAAAAMAVAALASAAVAAAAAAISGTVTAAASAADCIARAVQQQQAVCLHERRGHAEETQERGAGSKEEEFKRNLKK